MNRCQFRSRVAWRSRASCLAAAFALAGCTPDTVSGPSASDKAAQRQSALEGVDQAAVSKTGKRSGSPIITKSVKGLIKKDAQL